MVTELQEDNLTDLVQSNSQVMVQFSAGWCGNCRMMKPKFKAHAQQLDGVKFVIADAEKYPESRKLANVDNLPTFAMFENGKLKNQVQTNKAEMLKEFIHENTAN